MKNLKAMKSLIKILAVCLLINVSTLATVPKASAQVSVSMQLFYDNLSPYGTWVSYPSYGYVWMPNAGPGFSPYGTAGHWVFTEFGWTWVSDYAWGWAPFHYGSWMFDPFYGWMWVPDVVWGPAWVSWVEYPGYYGWAPIPPGVSVGVIVGGGYHIPHNQYIFVNQQYINSPNIGRYYAPRSDNEKFASSAKVINRTTVDNSRHVTYITGPDREQVKKATGKDVQPVKVQNRDKPGESVSGNNLNIYRPEVHKSGDNGVKPAPKKSVDVKELKKNNGNDQQMDRQPVQKNGEPVKRQTPANTQEQKDQKAAPPEKRSAGEPDPKMDQQPNNQPAEKREPPKDNPDRMNQQQQDQGQMNQQQDQQRELQQQEQNRTDEQRAEEQRVEEQRQLQQQQEQQQQQQQQNAPHQKKQSKKKPPK